MPRSRPQLRKNVVPSLLLHIKVTPAKRRKSGKPQVAFEYNTQGSMNSIKNILDEAVSTEEITELPKIEITENISLTAPEDQQNFSPPNKEAFINLYEEIFDVTLPSEIWGIHRDPQETLIAFSRLNLISSEVDLIVLIDINWQYTVRLMGVVVKKGIFQQLDSESVTALLDEIQETHQK